jgi:hypothetical protein
MVVSGVRKEQAWHSDFKNLLSVARESMALQILVHGHPMRDTPVLCAPPFPQMGDACNIGMSLISLKREMGSL